MSRFYSPTGSSITVTLMSGHSRQVPPEGVDLPEMFHKKAIQMGCFPMSVSATAAATPDKTFDRDKEVQQAIHELLETGAEDAFTNNDQPKVGAVNKLLGFKADRSEVLAAWEVVKAEIEGESPGESDNIGGDGGDGGDSGDTGGESGELSQG